MMEARGDRSGTAAIPGVEGISISACQQGSPGLGTGLFRTLGINVLSKSSQGLRPPALQPQPGAGGLGGAGGGQAMGQITCLHQKDGNTPVVLTQQ